MELIELDQVLVKYILIGILIGMGVCLTFLDYFFGISFILTGFILLFIDLIDLLNHKQ